jgi:hypothetical protein
MKRLVISLMIAGVLFAIVGEAFAQVDTAWVRRYDSPSHGGDAGYGICTDSVGNVYVTGAPATIKYSPAGDTLWVRMNQGPGGIGFVGRKIAVDHDGNVYVVGYCGVNPYYYMGVIKYSPVGDTLWVRSLTSDQGEAVDVAVDSGGNVIVTGTGNKLSGMGDYATLKYAPDGDTLWVRYYDGPDHLQDEVADLALDGQGNVYVTGRSNSIPTSYDYCTIKYSPIGQELWVRKYNGPGNFFDGAGGVAVNPLGGIYVSGTSYGAGSGDYCTVRYTPAGDTLWVRRYDGPASNEEQGGFLAVGDSGNAYMSGWSYGVGTGKDYCTIKYSPQGDSLWVQRYNGPLGDQWDEVNGLALDSARNVYVTGYSYGIGSDIDYCTIKYSSGGSERWVARYNGPANNVDNGRAITVDRFGDVIVTGSSRGAGYDLDYCTIKYHSSSGVAEHTSHALIPSRSHLRIQPNPFSSFATVPGHSHERFSLYDVSGRRVGTYRGDRIGEGLRAGVYFLRPEGKDAKPVRVVKVR